MKQKLLTDIELDVHELKLLMNTFSKEPTQTLSELLKRSILRMQERLEQLSEEISAVPVEASPSPVAEAETEAPIPIVEEQAPVIEEVECSAIEEPVVEENEATAPGEDEPVIVQEPQTVVEETVIEEPVVEDEMEEKEAESVRIRDIWHFLETDLGQRTKAAALNRLLFREQPFVIARKASELEPEWQCGESVLVQGIIDAYFIEDEEIVLVDYKTDFVRRGEEQKLIERYHVQLEDYAEALERMTGRKVKERYIYSFALGKEILC